MIKILLFTLLFFISTGYSQYQKEHIKYVEFFDDSIKISGYGAMDPDFSFYLSLLEYGGLEMFYRLDKRLQPNDPEVRDQILAILKKKRVKK